MKTDSQIQADIRAELGWDPGVQAERVGVDVKDGIASLAGEVDSFAEKWAAVRAAQRVPGVQAMVTALQVRLKSSPSRPDRDVAAVVANLHAWHLPLRDVELDVMVESGWVTTTGHVQSQEQHDLAWGGVRAIMGVQGVVDRVAICPGQDWVLDAGGIELALCRSARLPPGRIRVTLDGSTVILRGAVMHWAERQSAVAAARRIAGVRHVRDELSTDG